MDTEYAACLRLITVLAALNERLNSFQLKLISWAGLTAPRGAMDVRAYLSGSMIERYVEADAADGSNICWWVEFSVGGQGWLIQSRIYVSHGEVLCQFPDRNARDLDELGHELACVAADFEGSLSDLPRLADLKRRPGPQGTEGEHQA